MIQFTFSLRAKTKRGDFYYFTISDAPVLVSKNTVALMGAPNTPLLLADTITAGYANKYFIGDVLNDEYLVRYRDGFHLLRMATEEVFPLSHIGYNFEITHVGVRLSEDSNINLRFRYRNMLFRMNDILGYKDKYLILKHSKLIVPADHIATDAILSKDGERIFLSESTGICLSNGEVCKLSNNKIISIKET